VPAQTIYGVTSAQLMQATFVSGAAGSYDDLYMEAFDGKAYSGWNSYVHVAVNHAPVVTPTPANVRVNAGEVLQAAGLFSTGDDDGDTLSYYLYDSNAAAGSGHFVVDGTVVPAQTIYGVTSAQLMQATFVSGAAGSYDDLYMEAFDGKAYSGWNTFVHVATNTAPVVTATAANVSANVGDVLQVASLFSASDNDGDALSYYLYDNNAAASSGHFVVGGTSVPAQTIVAVTAAQLAQASFVPGAAGTSDDLYLQAFDGKAYSGWNTFVHVATNTAPVVTATAANVSANVGDVLQVAHLFSASDNDGDALSYYLYDNNPAASSGHFVVGGTSVPAQTIYGVTAAELAQASFVPGAAGTSDDLFLEAFDGKAFSGWNTYVHVDVLV
jgi:hypothetical protein